MAGCSILSTVLTGVQASIGVTRSYSVRSCVQLSLPHVTVFAYSVSPSYPGAHLERRQSQQGHPSRRVLQLMEKIPEEAESLTVLVGGVKFLEQPVVAFVRLAQVRVFVRFVRM